MPTIRVTLCVWLMAILRPSHRHSQGHKHPNLSMPILLRVSTLHRPMAHCASCSTRNEPLKSALKSTDTTLRNGRSTKRRSRCHFHAIVLVNVNVRGSEIVMGFRDATATVVASATSTIGAMQTIAIMLTDEVRATVLVLLQHYQESPKLQDNKTRATCCRASFAHLRRRQRS